VLVSEAFQFEGFLAESSIDGEGRKAGAIRNVLLCGLKSLNGRTFAVSAFTNAKALYENVHVYLNHCPEKQLSRDVRDLAGIVENVRLDSLGRPRGDVRLNRNKAGTELLALYEFSQRAEKHGAKLKDVGFSHVATYVFSPLDRSVVEGISHVYSCDVVIRPATTSSFQESEKQIMDADFNPSQALERLGSDDLPSEWTQSSVGERAVEAIKQCSLHGDLRMAGLYGAGLVHNALAESRSVNKHDVSKALEDITFEH